MKIFSGSNSGLLSNKVCSILGVSLSQLQIDKFSDGEMLPLFKETVRDEDVFFIQTPDSSDDIMETLLVIG